MLEFQNISFSYEKKQIFDNFSFHLKKGETVALMGASGCGKTTLLSLAAALIKPTKGEIRSSATRISYVFQEPRLFPWLTVEENLRAVIREDTSDEKIAVILNTLGLSDCAQLYPQELSGGMKSRVSLARALIFDGDLFLLDEPFAALDEELRHSIGQFLKQHFHEKGVSAILVTHQLNDAERLADRILYL
ncbi:MAG: ABC transporter ATP-binding protein [Clostridia bacterium]|nr:ABC transporter ATP-binding protein [Clostridia bacterium]